MCYDLAVSRQERKGSKVLFEGKSERIRNEKVCDYIYDVLSADLDGGLCECQDQHEG